MNVSCYLLLLSLVLLSGLRNVNGGTPNSPPQLSEVFFSSGKVIVRDRNGVQEGTGIWGSNQPAGMEVKSFQFGNHDYDEYDLSRYDLGKSYEKNLETNGLFLEFELDGSMPAVWSWLADAEYVGKEGEGSGALEIWKAELGYATMRLAVSASAAGRPIYLARDTRGKKVTTFWFESWSTSAPDMDYFKVPDGAVSAETLSDDALEEEERRESGAFAEESPRAAEACIFRATIIRRAKVWVTNHVPYNQAGSYQGYRTDCSGYVSMCWESSKPGHVTQTMYQIAKPIRKADLKPGDCLLYAAEHVVLFGGWTNTAKTQYLAYEESNPRTGTVSRPTPYPYWYNKSSFKPYRFNNVCD